jgi:cell wall-associated NlpC family hydrolase
MWSNKYIGIPFVEHGRTADGLDCWGLVRLVYAEQLAIDLPSYDFYENTLDKSYISGTLKDADNKPFCVSVENGQEVAFDVIVFRLMGVPMHVAIVIGDGLMLHSQMGLGTHVSNYRTDKDWNRRLVGIYRHANCTNSPTPV